MSAICLNYFNFNYEVPSPAEPNVSFFPYELLAHIVSYMVNSDTKYKNIVSCGLVCKFFLAQCILSCSRFRSACFLNQLKFYQIGHREERKSSMVYRFSQTKRSEADGTLVIHPVFAWNRTFNVMNLTWPKAFCHYQIIRQAIEEDLGIQDNEKTHEISDRIINIFKSKQTLLVVTERVIFFYKINDLNLKFEKILKVSGDVGFLNETIYSLHENKLFKCRIDGSEFKEYLSLSKFGVSKNLISTADHLFLCNLEGTFLQEIIIDEEGQAKEGRKIILSAPIRSCPYYSIYKNYFAYIADEKGKSYSDQKNLLCLIDLHTGEEIIRKEDNLIYPCGVNANILMRDDFLFIQYTNGSFFCMHLASRRNFTEQVTQFLNPLLKGQGKWLIDLAVIYDEGDKLPRVRFWLGDENSGSEELFCSWLVDAELENRAEEEIKIPATSSKRFLTIQKICLIAAASFVCLGGIFIALFQNCHIPPLLIIGKTSLSIPSLISGSLAISLALLALSASYLPPCQTST
jgi:hypothetical protein